MKVKFGFNVKEIWYFVKFILGNFCNGRFDPSSIRLFNQGFWPSLFTWKVFGMIKTTLSKRVNESSFHYTFIWSLTKTFKISIETFVHKVHGLYSYRALLKLRYLLKLVCGVPLLKFGTNMFFYSFDIWSKFIIIYMILRL